jgi:hypothetical protein
MKETMRIQDILASIRISSLSQEAKVRITNVLHALLDNLALIGCKNTIESIHARRRRIESMLRVDFPYVRETLREIFALPEVIKALVDGPATCRLHPRSHHGRRVSHKGEALSEGPDGYDVTGDDFDDGGDFDDTCSEDEGGVTDDESLSPTETSTETVVTDEDVHAVHVNCYPNDGVKEDKEFHTCLVAACCFNAVMAFSSVVCVVAMWSDLRSRIH